eukprot:COSAG02_NODE_3476_length_6675_cov_38.602342_9_plen_151_part_00
MWLLLSDVVVWYTTQGKLTLHSREHTLRGFVIGTALIRSQSHTHRLHTTIVSSRNASASYVPPQSAAHPRNPLVSPSSSRETSGSRGWAATTGIRPCLLGVEREALAAPHPAHRPAHQTAVHAVLLSQQKFSQHHNFTCLTKSMSHHVNM